MFSLNPCNILLYTVQNFLDVVSYLTIKGLLVIIVRTQFVVKFYVLSGLLKLHSIILYE